MEFAIRIHGASSLKDRRQAVRSLLDKIKSRFNASTADLGPDGVWDVARLGVVCAGSSSTEVEERVSKMRGFVDSAERFGEFEPFDLSQEVFENGDI